MHSYHSQWFRLSLFFTLFSQQIRSLRIRSEQTWVRSRSYDPVESLAEVMRSEIYPHCFANSFGTLDHSKIDCGAEELTQGQHLVILMIDTRLRGIKCTGSILWASDFTQVGSKAPSERKIQPAALCQK